MNGHLHLEVKGPCDALRSIDVSIDDDEMVQVCFRVLATWFGTIRLAILTRENPPSFDLLSMLLVEENQSLNEEECARGTHALFELG